MKTYISPRIEEIKMKADIIATSLTDPTQPGPINGYEGELEQFAPTRHGRYDMY